MRSTYAAQQMKRSPGQWDVHDAPPGVQFDSNPKDTLRVAS